MSQNIKPSKRFTPLNLVSFFLKIYSTEIVEYVYKNMCRKISWIGKNTKLQIIYLFAWKDNYKWETKVIKSIITNILVKCVNRYVMKNLWKTEQKIFNNGIDNTYFFIFCLFAQ